MSKKVFVSVTLKILSLVFLCYFLSVIFLVGFGSECDAYYMIADHTLVAFLIFLYLFYVCFRQRVAYLNNKQPLDKWWIGLFWIFFILLSFLKGLPSLLFSLSVVLLVILYALARRKQNLSSFWNFMFYWQVFCLIVFIGYASIKITALAPKLTTCITTLMK